MTDGLVTHENRLRTEAYRKDEAIEAEVRAINEALAAHEPDVPVDAEPLPHLFVFGLPRSGTTLLHQVLAWSLDVGYVSNVLARFWLAPHAGAVLSQAILGSKRDDSFASDYGKTEDVAGGHEFAYFWQRWLAVREVEDLLDFSGDSESADWDGAAAALRCIQAAYGKPMLYKTNYAAQFLPQFASVFPQPLFLHIVRDPVEVALSIRKARIRYYGDDTTWWATYPPDYPQLAKQAPAEQIAGQVTGLRRVYAEQVSRVPAELVFELSLDELAADPRGVVERVRQRCLDVHGTAPALSNEPPAAFTRTRPEPESAEEHELVRAMRATEGAA